MKITDKTKFRLAPEDEYTHPIEKEKNFNESMYFNIFDFSDRNLGGWFRIGNRPNEGYAEVSCCVYLPDGQIGFMYSRSDISDNDALKAGGMEFKVIEPFKKMTLVYEGKVCLLRNPLDMSNPKKAFTENPLVDCRIDIDYTGVAPMFGGEQVNDDGTPIIEKAEESFARAHYEQHISGKGTFRIGNLEFQVNGFGLRDHSWGPRYWQNIYWYRWLPMSFDENFAMTVTIVASKNGDIRRSGMVLSDNKYLMIEDAKVESEWDDNHYQKKLSVWAKTAEREYEIEGRVLSLIPLRNRRKTPDGKYLNTRITEGMTEYKCDGKTGFGMSEYLDQIIDGFPVGKEES